MNQPTVCAVMLTADRPELARRAVECFRQQTYDPSRRMLLIYDSGEEPFRESSPSDAENELHLEPSPWNGQDTFESPLRRATIGELRNEAITETPASIIIHWDDDDYSHPARIAEQVALLQSSGADVVGYREMLFWREGANESVAYGREPELRSGEAWLYSNSNPTYALGTSLCYWRKTWEQKPFAATSVGEDLQFITGLKCVGVSSRGGADYFRDRMMIARIHAGNSSTAYQPEKMARASEWKRVPEWDAHCRSIMEEA